MIDLHTHILPGIDDGACDREEAFELTKALREQNVNIAICTPHYNPALTSLEDFVDRRTMALRQMSSSVIRLIPASETMLHEYLFHYPDLSLLCVENTKYLLLEMPFLNKWDDKIYEQLSKIISYYDIIPIIAHIERYPAVKRCKRCVKELMQLGCILQLNTSSIFDRKLRRRAFYYLKKGYIDVLGSDCHNRMERPPVILPAMNEIKKRYGVEACNELESNANRIVYNQSIRREKTYLIQ